MDRIDAMKVFVTALDEGSLAGAARKLGRSAAAVSRAVAVLEGHVGVQPLHRTTRLIKLSEAGKRYAVGCRRMLTDLEEADILAAGGDRPNSWSFPPAQGSTLRRTVQFTPRFVVNSVRAAVASAVEGRGGTRVLSYQVAQHVRDGRLRILLRSDEHAALPVHIVTPQGRLSVPKVRAFFDFAAPRLRVQFVRLAGDAGS